MKEENTLMLLKLMQKILQTFTKTNEVRVEAWTQCDTKTLKVVMEVRVPKKVPYYAPGSN